MPLSGFAVVQEHSEQPDAVLMTCFDGTQTLLVFVSYAVIDDYFRRQDLTARQRNLLVMRNLDNLVPVVSGRYERGEVSTYASPTGRAYPRIDLTAADLERAPEKLTASVLDIDARAGFQAGVWSGPPQTSLTPPVAGVAGGGHYTDVSYTDFSPRFTQPGSQNTPLPLAVAGPDPTSPPEPIPPQGAGPHFRLGAAGRIALAPPSELDAAGNDIGRIREFLPLVRRAADDLATALNPNQFTVLSRNLADYRAAIEPDAPGIAWGVVFGLGVRLANAADAAQRQIEDRLLSALEDPAQEALQSLNMLHGSLIMATAEGRELEDQADRLQMTREQEAALRADAVAIAAELHRAAELIEPQAEKMVTAAAEVIGDGQRAERGTVFGIATLKHVTIVLVSAGTLVAMGAAVGGEIGAALGGGLGTAVGTGATWLGLEALKKSATFTAATAALGEGFDRLREVEGARFRQVLIQLAPLRRFVADNQEPLRRIATNTRQMRWMLPYIDFIVPQNETKAVAPPSGDLGAEARSEVQLDERPSGEMELSFDRSDPECIAQVAVTVFGPGGKIERSSVATSIRVRVQANSSETLKNVMAYITRIEKLMAVGDWQESGSPDIQLIWVGDIPVMEIPAFSMKYVNLLHIDHSENRLGVWQNKLPSLLEDFFRDAGTYRLTVSVLAQGVTRKARIEVDWKRDWDTIEVRSA